MDERLEQNNIDNNEMEIIRPDDEKQLINLDAPIYIPFIDDEEQFKKASAGPIADDFSELSPTPFIYQPEPEMAEQVKPAPPKKRFGRKLAAACLVAVIGGTSIGAGLSIGNGFVNNYLSKAQEQESVSLVFSNEAEAVSVQPSIPIAYPSNTENNIADVVNGVLDSVVSINIKGQEQSYNYFFGSQTYQPQGAGSGFIYAEDGEKIYIVTNYHVIVDAVEVTISVDDKTMIPANYVGGDEEADVAVMSVNKSDMEEAGISYKAAVFGDSDQVRIGEYALAIGNALGEGKTVTMGIISAVKNEVSVQDKTMNLIQTDAAINQGNSGGPLINIDGYVIGINTAKLSGTGIEGMGYSIPSNTVKEVADTIINEGNIDRPYLGIECRTITEDMKAMYNLPSVGVYVNNVVQGGPAANAGMIATDIIVGFEDKQISSFEELTDAIASHKSGDTVKVYIYRNGKTPTDLYVTLQNRNEKF